MRDYIHLHVNGRPVDVFGDDAFLTLSDFLRRRQRLTGTKVVCAEGDCGSCAALIGRPDASGGMKYSAVTSCIQLVFQLDGAHVVTVEGLRDGQSLNPIQQAMVTCQGTQCGFCTPGFVVSLYDLMHDGKPVDPDIVKRGLVGNLCRCTGYDSITCAALKTDRSALKSLDALYPPGPLSADLSRAAEQPVRLETKSRKFFKPTSVAEACKFRGENPGCAVAAGATDVGVVHNKRIRVVTAALAVGALPELKGVRVDAESIYLGAAESLTALEKVSLEHLPELGRFLSWFGSPLIKNAGTLGGNVVNASPIGDTIPALLALEADIDIAGSSGAYRRVPISQFYTGYRKTVLAPDELVTNIRIPIPRDGEIFRLFKVSRRKDLDISGFGAAIWMRQGSAGTIDDIRIAYGGVGPMVVRMTQVEAFLKGGSATLNRFQEAARLAASQVMPISDVRGSDRYRRTLAHNILLKFWHEAITGPTGDGGNGSNGDGTPGGNGASHQRAGRAVEPLVARSKEGAQ